MIFKRLIKLIVLFLLLGIFLIVAVFVYKKEIPTAVNYLPDNSTNVVVLNVKGTAEKFLEESIVNNEEFDDLVYEGYEKDVVKFIERSFKGGVGIVKWLVAFNYTDTTTNQLYYGLIFEYSEKQKFLKFCSDIFSPYFGQSVINGNFTHFGKRILAFNDDIGLYLYSPKEIENSDAFDVADQILKEKSGGSLYNKSEDFRKIFERRFDAAIWTRYAKSSMINSQAITLKLTEGSVDADFILSLKEGNDPNFIKKERLMTNDNGYMTLDYEIPLSEFVDTENKNNLFTLDVDSTSTLGSSEILKLFDGSISVNFHSINNYEFSYTEFEYDDEFNKVPVKKESLYRLPEFDAVLEIEDHAKFDQILAASIAGEKLYESRSDIYYWQGVTGYKVFFKKQGDNLLLSSQRDRLTKSSSFVMKTPEAYMIMDLNFNKLQSTLPNMMDRVGMKALNIFGDVDVKIDRVEGNCLVGRGKLSFLDSGTHSLSQLISLSLKTGRMMNEITKLIN